MIHEKVNLSHKQADGYIIPCGKFNLVLVVTEKGMVGCGAFDVVALDKFQFPAARVRPSRGNSIASLDDLIAGIIKDANNSATKLGVRIGMTGKEALDRM